LDLSPPTAEFFDRLSRSRKRQIKSWNARGAWLCTDRERLIDFMIANAPDFFASRGASATYAFSPRTWRALASAPNVYVIGALSEGEVVAATLFGFAGLIAEALFNISLPQGRDAATSLMWRGALHLKSLGIAMLNMGGG